MNLSLSSSRRLWTLLALALPVLVGVAVYAYSVRMSFYLDDGLLFTMIRDYPGGTPGFRFWPGSPSFAYYRPAVFSIWEFQQMALGRFDPFSLHALNVFAFGFSAGVLAAIARRLTRSTLAGMLAGLVFALFPFSYNAVIWVASQFHVLMVLGLLLAMRFGLLWLDGRGLWSLILALLSAFVGIFSHENGVLILPLLGLLALQGRDVLKSRRVWALFLPLTAIVAVYVYLVLTVPRPGPEPNILWPMLLDSFAMMIQGISFPLNALVRRLAGVEGSTALLIVLALIVLVPGLIFLARTRRRLAWVAGFGVAWYILAALPTILLLETEYIRGSWRLMMLSSGGAALFWAALILGLVQVQPRRDALRYSARGFGWGTLLLIVVVSVGFLNQRRGEALIQSDYLWALQDVLEEHMGEAPLVINAPAFMHSNTEDRYFLTTGMGVMTMYNYVHYGQQFWAQTGRDYPYIHAMAFYATFDPDESLTYAPYWTVPPTTDFTEQLRQATDVYVTVFDGRRVYPVYVGGPDMAGPDEAIASFMNEGIHLTEAVISEFSSDEILVRTRWRVESPSTVVPVVEVWCDEAQIAQSVLDVWGGVHPFRVWRPGEIQTDIRTIKLENTISAACLQVTIGLVDEGGGELYPAEVEAEIRRFDSTRVLAETAFSQG